MSVPPGTVLQYATDDGRLIALQDGITEFKYL
jgi:hypothetical protein